MGESGTWSRRQFVGVAVDAAKLAVVASLLRPVAALAADGSAAVTLYDPRFAAAKNLAQGMPGGATLRAIHGDPTDLVLAGMAAGPWRLQGVTTESVPFCLQQLQPRARLQLRRIDRDLFAWTLDGAA